MTISSRIRSAVLSAIGMFLLSAATPAWVLAGILVLTGTGLGFFVQVSLLAGQNAVPSRDLGVATVR